MGADSYGFFICGNSSTFIHFIIIEISLFRILILLNSSFIYRLKKLSKRNYYSIQVFHGPILLLIKIIDKTKTMNTKEIDQKF